LEIDSYRNLIKTYVKIDVDESHDDH